jgi:hypothetical protein
MPECGSSSPDGTTGYTTVADLKAGSLRNADYTRKTQEVAEQRKQFETQSSVVKQREQQLEQNSQYIARLIQAIVPAAPDPATMQTDPMGYLQQKRHGSNGFSISTTSMDNGSRPNRPASPKPRSRKPRSPIGNGMPFSKKSRRSRTRPDQRPS